MKELVIISGKGGTGKTSLTASLASLAQDVIAVDCDVDAADMHLLVDNKIIEENDFEGGKVAVINNDHCIGCNICVDVCRFDAIKVQNDIYMIDEILCEGCGVCAWFCGESAIKMETKISGKWFISETNSGPLVHAALGIAEDNSGKLVSLIRGKSKELAKDQNKSLIIIDGPPGIGCPVIASVTGTNLALIVSEPTVSGMHDLERVFSLINHFKIKCMICINKYDLNLEMTKKIEDFASINNIEIAAKIPYNNDFTEAQIQGKSIVEFSNGELSQIVRNMWDKISNYLL